MARITIEVVTDNTESLDAVRELAAAVHQRAEADEFGYHETTTTLTVDDRRVETWTTDAADANEWLHQVLNQDTRMPLSA